MDSDEFDEAAPQEATGPVDWELLPARPESFFALSAGYDRRDLKRAYNRLVRRYKPERFPAEFQRIRAAYEELERALRYRPPAEPTRFDAPGSPPTAPSTRSDRTRPGTSDPARFGPGNRDNDLTDLDPAGRDPTVAPVPHEPAAYGNASPASKPRSTGPTRPVPSRPPLNPELILAELEHDSPAALLSRLRSDALQSPYHVYCRALLTDLVAAGSAAGDHPHAFALELAAGLRSFPTEPALAHLLASYCQGSEGRVEPERLVEDLAALDLGDLYYFCTEAIWLRLAHELDFASLRALLERCEQRLGGSALHGQLVFSIGFCRAVAFRADLDWLRRRLASISEGLDAGRQDLDWEVYQLELLLDYRAHRDEFLGEPPHPLRVAIDAALRARCELPEPAADAAIVSVLYEVLHTEQDLLVAIPQAAPAHRAVLLLGLLAEEVHERWEFPEFEPEPAVVERHARALAHDLQVSNDWSLLGALWMLTTAAVFVGFYGVFLAVPAIVIFTVFRVSPLPIGFLFIWMVLIVWHGHVRVIGPLDRKISARFGRAQYRRRWRRMALAHLLRNELPPVRLIEAMGPHAKGTSRQALTLMRHDPALELHALARRFVR